MPANPMQRKARNSFFLGAIISIIICILIGALLYLFVLNPNKTKGKNETQVIAYVLNQDIKSGQAITTDLLTPITVYQNMVPANYIDSTIVLNMEIQDKDGNVVKTNSDGKLYLERDNKKIQVELRQNSGKYYITYNGETEELEQAPVIAKIAMNKNTVLTSSAVAKGEKTSNDLRYVEYNMLTLGTTVSEGDFVDVRITFPNGQDLIVVSKREVKSIYGNTVGFEMTEGEISMMESAIVEAYIMKSSKLYVVQYVEPGMQTAATKTYVPTEAVQRLIEGNPNIETDARNALVARFDSGIRSWADNNRGAYAAEEKQNLEEGIQQEIQDAKAARENYLSGLTGYETEE